GLLHLLGQMLDRRLQALHSPLQRRHSSFEGLEVVLDGDRGLVPERLGEGAFGLHEARGYATWVSPDKYFSPRPRERLPFPMPSGSLGVHFFAIGFQSFTQHLSGDPAPGIHGRRYPPREPSQRRAPA